MKRDYIDSGEMAISDDAVAQSAVSMIDAGSLLFVVRGMILAHSFPVALTRVPLTINQDMKALTLRSPEHGEFLLRALKGMKSLMLRKVQRSSHGTCRIEARDYSEFLVPIPPPAEQRRIVAKVDELLAECDRLEMTVARIQTAASRVLDAALQQARATA